MTFGQPPTKNSKSSLSVSFRTAEVRGIRDSLNHDLSLSQLMSILGLDRFKWRLLAPVSVDNTFMVQSTGPPATRAREVVPGTQRRIWVGFIMAMSAGLCFVVALKIKEVPKGKPWDIFICQSYIHISINNLLLVLECPISVCLVVPFEKAPSTSLANEEGLLWKMGSRPCGVGVPEPCWSVQLMLIRIPSWVAIETHSSGVLQTLVVLLFARSPRQEPRWIFAGRSGTGGICSTSFLMIRRTFIEPSPHHDGWVIHTCFQHFLDLLQLILHEIWVLSVLKRHAWTQSLLPHDNAGFIQSI